MRYCLAPPAFETVRRTSALIALILGMLAMLAVAAPAPVRAAAPVSFGAYTPGDPYNGRTDGTDALQSALGRRIGIVSWFHNWGGDPWVRHVHPHVFNAVLGSGRRPLVTWEPWAPGRGASQPKFSLRRINDGTFDGYIASWASSLRDLRSTVYLRPMHEMNGNWYPWGGTVNGNSSVRFRAAWRRMHSIFRRQGASNVRWVWSPISSDVPGTAANRMEAYYPGAAYVDVLAVDGYNFGSRFPRYGGWRSFRKIFLRAYRRLTKLGRQPIWVAEVGSSSTGGVKADWVRDMFRTARKWPRLRAIVWMDTNNPRESDWRARFPVGTAGAFKSGR